MNDALAVKVTILILPSHVFVLLYSIMSNGTARDNMAWLQVQKLNGSNFETMLFD